VYCKEQKFSEISQLISLQPRIFLWTCISANTTLLFSFQTLAVLISRSFRSKSII